MLDNSAIRPVPGRGEAHRAVRDEETRKKNKREAKEAKKRAVEEQAVDLLTLAPPIRGDVTPQETSGLVVPVTAGQWMSVPNSDPPLSPSSPSTALSTPVSSSHTEAQALPATTKPPPALDSAELKSKTGAEKDEKTNVPHDIPEQWQHLDHKLYDDLAKQLAAMLIQANSVSSPGTGQDKGKNEEKAIDIALEVPGDHEAVKLTLADLLADSNDLEKNENVEEKVSLLESERQEGNLVVEEYKDGSAEEPAPVESPEADRVQALGNEIDIAGKSDRGLELEYEIAHLRSKLLKRARASKVPRGDLYMDSDTAHPEKSAVPDDTPSLVSERGNGSDSVSTCREPADSLFGEESIQDDVDTADTAIGEKMDAEVTGGRGGFARVISLVS